MAPAFRILAALMIGLYGWPGSATPSHAQTAVPETAEEIQLSFAPIVKRAAPAVVNVYATERVAVRSPFEGDPFFERFFGGGPLSPFGRRPRERANSSLGSGVVVDADGVVVTNRHVIGNASEVRVALADGREYQAEILLRDERTDLAVLKIQDGEVEFPVLEFADSDALEVGDLVLAIGNPFGVGQTVTSGIVSAVARTEVGITDSSFFIQTDAAINPGNSGGALVDMRGDVVGINTAIYSRSGGSIGIGFAIPSNMVRIVVSQALAGSTTVARAWIGVQAQRVTPEIALSLGLRSPSGALVTRVDRGSPAERAGIRVGDLIVAVAGWEVRTPQALNYRLAIAGVGQTVELAILRDGQTVSARLSPEAEPELSEDDLVLLEGESPLAGAIIADVTTVVADRLRLREGVRGVVIVDVDPRSEAARIGVRPGDVIAKLQGEDIETAEQLQALAREPHRFWRVTINRNGRVAELVIGG